MTDTLGAGPRLRVMTATHRVHVTQHYTCDQEVIFAKISEHENLGELLPTSVRRVRDGDHDRNGVGSVRSLRVFGFGPPFEETVTKVDAPERIEYTITKGGPLRDHAGVITVRPVAAGGSVLEWTIDFSAPIPGLAAILQRVLTASIRKGLPKLAE